MALQLHPDKNKAPGAIEAFKSVGTAAAVLTDPEKRKHYDLYGPDDRVRPGHRHGHSHGGEYEADVTAEELFNMFFNGNRFSQDHVFTRQRRYNRTDYQRQTNENQSNVSALFNLLPILLLIAFSMMSTLFMSDPIYSLQPSQ